MIDYSQNPEYLEWANERLECKYEPDPKQLVWITKLKNGAIQAVAVFLYFTKHNCQIAIASDGSAKWLTRGFLKAVYGYAFNQMGLVRVTSIIREDNAKSLNLISKLGYTKEGLLLNMYGSKSGVLMRMLNTECRWIQETHV